MKWLGQSNLINCFSSHLHPFYLTASNFIIAIVNYVHMYFGAKKGWLSFYSTAIVNCTSETAVKHNY